MPRLNSAFSVFLFLSSIQAQAAPCLPDQGLAQVKNAEAAYMLGRIPPAFKHAYDDHRINLIVLPQDKQDSGSCVATLIIDLPADDLKEANEILEKDPAKKILLFSQGYSLPDQPRQSASFEVDRQTLQVAHQEMLQTHQLGKLHASVEMMYALLTQFRAANLANEADIKPWSPAFLRNRLEGCIDHAPIREKAQETCQCKVQELSKHYEERTMEYILYVQSNPFAEATGASAHYIQLQSEIDRQCRQVLGI